MGSKHSFAGMSQLELKCIVMRVQGLTYREIGKRIGKSERHAQTELSRVFRKTGIEHTHAALVEWAEKWGFDEPLLPESPEERARPGKPVARYQKIRLGRIRRSGFHPVKGIK